MIDVRFVALVLARRIVETVTFAFSNLPRGVRPEDNDAGTRLSLEQLARFVGG